MTATSNNSNDSSKDHLDDLVNTKTFTEKVDLWRSITSSNIDRWFDSGYQSITNLKNHPPPKSDFAFRCWMEGRQAALNQLRREQDEQ